MPATWNALVPQAPTTPAMYATLRTLVQDLSQKYSIPIEEGRIVGHEDVNPIARFGWDPSAGFDWSRILS